MKRSAPILLAAGILAVAIFLAKRPTETPVRAPAAGPSAGVAREEPQPEVALEGANVAPTERASIAESPASEDAASWRVCAVDGATGEPVPGATVSVFDARGLARDLAELGIGFDSIAGLKLRGERAVKATTGPDGCARFSLPVTSLVIEARAGDRWAFAVLNQRPADGCVRLKLGPDRSLLVRVVDGLDRPVGGVPVALRRKRDERPVYDWKWTDTAPGSGVAAFLHFQRRLEQGPGWHATFAFPVRGEPLVPVDATTPNDPPATLVLLGSGSLRIRVRGPDGSVPSLESAELRVDAFEGAPGGPRLWPDGPWAQPKLDAHGEAIVAWIGLGLQVKAALLVDGAEIAAQSSAGPTRTGEEVVIELEAVLPARPFVTGRFVLQDGRAWPAGGVRVQLSTFPSAPIPLPDSELPVEEGGRFRLEVSQPVPAGGSRTVRFVGRHPDRIGEVVALVPLNEEIQGAGLDLGDVLLDHGALILSGRVADSEGRPVAGASFALHARTIVSGQEFWPGVRCSGTNATGEDGRFALHLPQGEEAPSDDLRLTTSAKGFVADRDREVRRGEQNVDIMLARAGALAGALDLDRDLEPREIVLFLRGREWSWIDLHPDATFELQGLAPDTYSLAVWRIGADGRKEEAPAAEVRGLEVRAGETCRDPRIQGLRVESAQRSLKIRCIDRARAPLENVAVSVVELGAVRPPMSGEDGVCRVRAKSLPVDLDVSAFGYRRQRLAAVDGDREVVLVAGFPIRLRIDARSHGSEPKYLLWVLLHDVDGQGRARGPVWGRECPAGGLQFDDRGELSLRVPAEGVYECSLQVTVLSGGVGRGSPVRIEPNPRITVLASEAEQVFALSVPQSAVEEAVASALR